MKYDDNNNKNNNNDNNDSDTVYHYPKCDDDVCSMLCYARLD